MVRGWPLKPGQERRPAAGQAGDLGGRPGPVGERAGGGPARRREAEGGGGTQWPGAARAENSSRRRTRTAGGRDVSSARGAVPRVRVRREHAQKLLPDRGALEVGAPARRGAIGTFGRWPVAGVPSPQHPLVPPTHS